jgi:hypothetical protein
MLRARYKIVLGVCCSLTLVLLLACGSTLSAATAEVAITGTVYASAWDSNDNVTAVVIVTDEGDEYSVAGTAAGRELLKLNSKLVKAVGKVATDVYGQKTITVTKYIVEE